MYKIFWVTLFLKLNISSLYEAISWFFGEFWVKITLITIASYSIFSFFLSFSFISFLLILYMIIIDYKIIFCDDYLINDYYYYYYFLFNKIIDYYDFTRSKISFLILTIFHFSLLFFSLQIKIKYIFYLKFFLIYNKNNVMSINKLLLFYFQSNI